MTKLEIAIVLIMAMIISFILGIFASEEAKAARPILRLAPPVVCTMHNRLDIFIDEDNIMWACECEALKTGHICRWQVIGGVDTPEARRFRRSHRLLFLRLVPPLTVRIP